MSKRDAETYKRLADMVPNNFPHFLMLRWGLNQVNQAEVSYAVWRTTAQTYTLSVFVFFG